MEDALHVRLKWGYVFEMEIVSLKWGVWESEMGISFRSDIAVDD